MATMRRMEFAADDLYKNKEIRGFCHLYIGQEAIAVGMEDGITKDDCIITAYREHCNALARGDTTSRILAEMMSRATGSTKGKGGSMHYYNRKMNFFGGNGIVGAQLPLGTGIGFALKYLGKKNACFTMYGDGTANQGQLFESSNMAGLWKLPMIYLCENNHYGMGTSESRASFYRPLMAKFRGFPGFKCDGMDVFAIRESIKFAKEYAIKNGPVFLEIDTYRYLGHSMSDPGVTYRTKDEVAQWKKTRDCIDKVKDLLFKHNLVHENEVKDLEKKIRKKIEAEVEQIKKEPFPDVKELYSNIFVEENVPFIRNVEYHDSVFNEHKE